ncbi:MAG: glycosyltransferase [Planctomycetota bacterium]|nr:MAG: glycosyltransferase [Planctomycetota bacterium]
MTNQTSKEITQDLNKTLSKPFRFSTPFPKAEKDSARRKFRESDNIGTSDIVLVVPCYNEAERFPIKGYSRLLEDDRISLRLVDDGSNDSTKALLDQFAANYSDRVAVDSMVKNRGKGEAVRSGMLAALDQNPEIVGFIDADLPIPAKEMGRLVDTIINRNLAVVMGSRVALLGSNIERTFVRHILSRVFATLASFALKLTVYDTQCGAKVFRDTPSLRAALAKPFRSRWAFDVELLGRLLREGTNPNHEMAEVPLRQCINPSGSKLGTFEMVKACIDLAKTAFEHRRSS